MRFSTVVFDLAGTLVGDWPEEAHRQNIRRMAEVLSVSYESFIQIWRRETFSEVKVQLSRIEDYVVHVCRILGCNPSGSATQKAGQLRSAFMNDLFLHPRRAALDTLTTLRANGFHIGLISNTSVEVPILWTVSPFAGLINESVFSCSVGLAKPEQRIYELASQKLNVCPSQCLYVGDGGDYELSGAKRAGMFPVLLRTPEAHRWIFDNSRADAKDWTGPRINDLREIVGLVGNTLRDGEAGNLLE
jgi:putative hydrolase of the HAD superfamily